MTGGLLFGGSVADPLCFACPFCGVDPGMPCERPGGRRAGGFHADRRQHADNALRTQETAGDVRVNHEIVLRKRDRGYDLYDQKGGYQVCTLSAMDAAELLFGLKDELQRTKLGRGCLDKVAARRRPPRNSAPIRSQRSPRLLDNGRERAMG